MNLVFKLDMCTCGGGACDEIVSTFFVLETKSGGKNFNNSFVFLALIQNASEQLPRKKKY